MQQFDAAVGSGGRPSPKTTIPPAIGTILESADDKGIAMTPRAEKNEFCNATIPTMFATITPYTYGSVAILYMSPIVDLVM